MEEPPRKERQSAPITPEKLTPLTPEETAFQEAKNTLLQYDRMTELIDEALSARSAFRLRPHIIQELNRISIQRIEPEAGRWRNVEMQIGQSSHKPPHPDLIPRYIDELCDYVNDNWNGRTGVHLAAYVMWRLNWIHPCIDGNGRTTRAVSYYVLCAKLGFRIPGVETIPERVAAKKQPYYEALERADRACENDSLDVTSMESLLKNLLASQLIEAIEREGSLAEPPKIIRVGTGKESSNRKEAASRDNSSAMFSTKVGAAFGAAALLFFMLLILLQIFGYKIPDSAKYLIVIVLALSGGLSAGFLGGHASARGSIPIPNAQQYPMRYAVSGGISVLVILLILGWFLFL